MTMDSGKSTLKTTGPLKSAYSVFRVSEDGRFLGANLAFARLLHFHSRTKFMAANQNLFQLCENSSEAEALAAALAKSGGVTNFPLSLRRSDGSSIALFLSLEKHPGRSLHAEGAKYEGAAEVVREGVKTVESASSKDSHDLAHLPAIPTTNRILLDLTDVLTIISGYTQLIDEAMKKDATTSYMLNHILSAVDRGTRLVHRLDVDLRQGAE
ncbi:MAG: hypothetical protein P4M01_12395 [Acidobacteriota bacterium]|nr:hypothetical protein [Acidobacteriota bacterium]